MPKVNKTFSIEPAIAAKLGEEDNQTALLEDLLRDHYGMGAEA